MVIAVMLSLTVSALAQQRIFVQKGVNFTAEGRDGYGSAKALESLRELPKYGVNAVALVPYGMTRPGTTSIRVGGLERDEHIERIAGAARSLGMKVMLKPQIWAPGRFVGDLDFDSEQQRNAWFAEYRNFIGHYANLATRIGADLFCVGTELARLSRFESEWRRIIAEVREVYRGPVTYAAVQGPEFETLGFWDALDYIGLNNYYPLPDDLSTTAVVAKVEAVQRRRYR